MKKIMFNDRYGLTEAVLTGRKTMTRRIVNQKGIEEFATDDTTRDFVAQHYAAYKVGEEIAVAQSYSQIEEEILNQGLPLDIKNEYKKHRGYRNKMFVRADVMPHRIRITDIKIELLQDISDEDCLKEGVFRYEGSSVNPYEVEGMLGCYYSPREAFADLIDRISGKDTWERNPYVFAYTFELVK